MIFAFEQEIARKLSKPMMMKWYQALFGRFFKASPDWDGSERRESFRARCDFELEIQGPGCRYFGRVVDAGPHGLRIRVRGPWIKRVLRRGQEVALVYVQPLFEAELDSVGGKICWVRRQGEQMFTMAVAFHDTLENLKRSWVRPVLARSFKMQSRRNLRKTLRARCNLPGCLFVDGHSEDVKVTDVSATGARVSSLRPLAAGSAVELTFENLHCRGLVRRCTQDYGVYRLGLAFQELPGQRQSLVKLVRRLTAMDKLLDS